MPDDPQHVTDVTVPAVTTEPAPVIETPVVSTEPVAEKKEEAASEPTDDEGAEPKKLVKKLISVRKRAQLAEEKVRELELERRIRSEVQGAAPQEKQPQAAPAGAPTPPDPEKFEGGRYSDEYEEALESYRFQRVKYDLKQEQERERQEENNRKQQAAARDVETKFQERIDAAAEEDPEIMTIQTDKTLPLSYAMAMAVKESDVSPKLLRYLHDNREEAKKIFDLAPSWVDPRTGQIMQAGNPLAAAKAIGRLEAKLSIVAEPKPKPKIVTAAPEPVKTVTDHGGGGNGVVPRLDDSTPTADWIKERNRREAAARQIRR